MKFATIITQEDFILTRPEDISLGDHQAYIARDIGGNIKHYIKDNYIPISQKKDPEFSYYLEVLAARFYKFFSSRTITADTTFFIKEDGVMNLASGWIEKFTPYVHVGLPYISNDKIVVKIEGVEREVQGYLEMLFISRFIGNFDCIGKGVNAGYLIDEEGIVRNVKIDPGGSFSFVDNNLFNVIYGSVLHINQIMAKKYLEEHKDDPDFYTNIPLEMIDHENPLALNEDFGRINIFLDYYYPDLDTRDLLIGNLRYQDIINNPSLYRILSEMVYKVVTINEEQLTSLIYDDMPVVINGEDLSSIKSLLLENMLNRRAAIYKLYKDEFKFFREQLTTHQEIILENKVLIPLSDIKVLAEKSMRVLLNLIDHIEKILYAQPDLLKLTKEEYVVEFERLYEDICDNIPEINLLYPRTSRVVELILEGNFTLVYVILKNNYDIALQLSEEIVKDLPENIKDMVSEIKELYGSQIEDFTYRYLYEDSYDEEGSSFVDLNEEEFFVIKWANHLLQIFEEAVSYDLFDLEGEIVTDILEQVAWLLSIDISSYSFPIFPGKTNIYGLPGDDGDDEGYNSYGASTSYFNQDLAASSAIEGANMSYAYNGTEW